MVVRSRDQMSKLQWLLSRTQHGLQSSTKPERRTEAEFIDAMEPAAHRSGC